MPSSRHETIYQALYPAHRTGLSRELTRKLRTGRALRKRRGYGEGRPVGFTQPGQLIHQRPRVAERCSSYLYLVALPEGHGANALTKALTSVL